jgi:hypothetical protein
MNWGFVKDWWQRRKERQAEEDRKWVEQAMLKHDVAAEEVVHAVFNEPDEELDGYSDAEELYDGVDDGRYEDYGETYERERHRSRVGIVATLMTIGGVFGLVIVGFMYLANSADSAGPSADSGLEALKQSIQPTPSANPTLNGNHIAFTYPAAFDVVSRPKEPWANNDEQYALSSKLDYRKTIEVYVEQVATPMMDSGYLVRSQQKSDYTASAIKVMGEPATVMVRNDLTERTLYWEHAGNLVIMSATGSGNDMAGWINMIAASLRWLK